MSSYTEKAYFLVFACLFVFHPLDVTPLLSLASAFHISLSTNVRLKTELTFHLSTSHTAFSSINCNSCYTHQVTKKQKCTERGRRRESLLRMFKKCLLLFNDSLLSYKSVGKQAAVSYEVVIPLH